MMTSMNELINAFLALTSVGGLFRITMLTFQIVTEPDLKDGNLKRIRNVCFFMVLAVLIFSLKGTVLKYFQ